MTQNTPLHNFHSLRTKSPEELKGWLKPAFAVKSLDMPERGRLLDSVVNHCELPSISLTYVSYGSPLQMRLSQNNYFVQGFLVSGSGEVRWNRHSTVVEQLGGGVVGGPGAEATISYGGSFSHVVFKTLPASLTRKLSALIGRPVDPPLSLTGQPNCSPRHFAAQRRLMEFLIGELDRSVVELPPIVLAEIEQAIIVEYLMATEHNYSHWLHGTPRAAAHGRYAGRSTISRSTGTSRSRSRPWPRRRRRRREACSTYFDVPTASRQ